MSCGCERRETYHLKVCSNRLVSVVVVAALPSQYAGLSRSTSRAFGFRLRSEHEVGFSFRFFSFLAISDFLKERSTICQASAALLLDTGTNGPHEHRRLHLTYIEPPVISLQHKASLSSYRLCFYFFRCLLCSRIVVLCKKLGSECCQWPRELANIAQRVV